MKGNEHHVTMSCPSSTYPPAVIDAPHLMVCAKNFACLTGSCDIPEVSGFFLHECLIELWHCKVSPV